jgi:protease IV
MKSFLKYTLASCLGITIALVAFTFFTIIFFVALFASFSPDSKVSVKKDTVLELKLKEFIPEHTNNIPSSSFDFSAREVIGYRDLISAVNHAVEDDKIIGLKINLDRPFLNFTAARDLMVALKEFSDSGKPVFIHGSYYSQPEYYLASIADHISLNPFGTIDFRGFGIIAPFLPDFLDKFGVKFNVYYAGDYKGAGETFYRRDFSEENREQLNDVIFKIYDHFLQEVSSNRDIPVERLQEIADNLLIRDEFSALDLGFVDAIEDRKEFDRTIKRHLGKDEDESLTTLSVAKYSTARRSDIRKRADNQIAVVYAEGNIVDGRGEGGMISDRPYVETIESLIENDNVDAVVLRINSGGGSVMASENIYRALLRLRESGKPFVVSMGDMAASGGYYIAAPSDRIFAERQTITGSIGVFNLIANVSDLVGEKLAIHYDTISTARYATRFNAIEEFTDVEHEYFQSSVDRVYDRFINMVSEERGLSIEETRAAAQGRIWMGEDALQMGLVDEIGGLHDAIAYAAQLAEIEEYRLRAYPQIKDPFLRFLEEFTGESLSLEKLALERLTKHFSQMGQIHELKNMTGLQARAPYYVIYK